MILTTHSEAFKEEKTTTELLRGLDQLMERKEDGGMYFIWVPLIGDVRTLIMDEAHASRYLVHPGADKTYYDLRDMYGGHAKIGESMLIGPELVQETTDNVVLIKENLKAAGDHQKSYANNRRKLLEFEKYLADANLHVHLEEIKVDKTLRFVKEPVKIIDRGIKSLKRSRILIVKVNWNLKRGHEDFIKSKYPHLLVELSFEVLIETTKFRDEISLRSEDCDNRDLARDEWFSYFISYAMVISEV
nr:putative reverse transcriptase domain-containing protein [Tanacetum cinerariifolium]